MVSSENQSSFRASYAYYQKGDMVYLILDENRKFQKVQNIKDFLFVRDSLEIGLFPSLKWRKLPRNMVENFGLSREAEKMMDDAPTIT